MADRDSTKYDTARRLRLQTVVNASAQCDLQYTIYVCILERYTILLQVLCHLQNF